MGEGQSGASGGEEMTRLVRSGDGPIFQSTAPSWLEAIMLRGPCAARKIGDEDGDCIMFADTLRQAALTGKLRATFTHIPHEVGGGAKNAGLRYSLAKAMGLVSGSGDFVFLWKPHTIRRAGPQIREGDYVTQTHYPPEIVGGCWIEFKRAKLAATEHRDRRDAGRLSSTQKGFRDWCAMLDVPYHVATSAREGLDILAGYGVLDR